MQKNDEQERNQWECLPNETSLAYKAFMTYLEMPRNDRSIYGAQMIFTKQSYNTKASKRASSSWRRWASQYKWGDRSSAYDTYNFNLRMKMRDERLRETEDDMAAALKEMRLIINKTLIDEKAIKNIQPQSLIRAYKDVADTELKVLGYESKSRVTNVDGGIEPVTTIRVTYVMSKNIQGEGGIDRKLSEEDVTYSDEPSSQTVSN